MTNHDAHPTPSDVAETAARLADTVSSALQLPTPDDRARLIAGLNDQLGEVGLSIHDTEAEHGDERKGTQTGRTREEVLYDLSMRKGSKWRNRIACSLGRRAL